MATKLGTIVADFTTQLATAMAVGATTASLQSATDDDGNALPAGVYFFAIDGNNSQKEHIVATLSGTSLTAISSVSRQGVQASGVVRSHRVGSTVTLTDFAHIKYHNDLLNGTTNFNASTPLGYDGTATISTANQFATKAYVDGVAIAGAADSSTTVKGITKMSVAPVSPTSPIAVGDNDTRVPTIAQTTALAGNDTSIAVGSGNKVVTQTGLQNGAETYAASTGSANAYVLTLSPVPAALAAGQQFTFKANFANTGAATLNVNSLGAKAIKKLDGATALVSGDIANGQIVTAEYDGTNFQMLSPLGQLSSAPAQYVFGTLTDLSTSAAGNNDATVTTTFTPRLIKLHFFIQGHDSISGTDSYYGLKGIAVYNGTTLTSLTTIYGDPTTSPAGAKLTGDAGTLNTIAGSMFTQDANTTTVPTAGTVGGGSSHAILLTLSIASVGATSFVVRRATSTSDGTPLTAKARIYYEAFA